jgi:capsular polysaccharide biosynthesis protein
MNLTEYGRILLRRGWIIVLLVLLAAGSAFLFSRMQTPIYRATQKLLVLPSRTDAGLANANRDLLDGYVELLRSTRIAAYVIETLQLDMTPGALLGEVTIASDRQRLMIQIDVDLPDASVASDVARTWGDWLVRFREEENQRSRREDRVNAIPIDDPQVSLDQPRTAFNVIAGALLGLLVGGVIVFVLEYLESAIVRRRDDLERVDIPVLATIPAGNVERRNNS